ncbi:MAG: VacB/RNase II family 3'-5' exoribonuclease [Elusimicrobia bacterium]|nr:VacB/RNase II family 3'-5' exoribonuclease [Elusimicrobiota bacterium]
MIRRGDRLEGVLQRRGHFGFLLSEVPGAPDVYVSGPSLRLALNGDRVEIRVVGGRGGRPAGEVTRVVSRARTIVVGTLRRAGKFWALIPDGGGEDDAVEVLGAAKGTKLAVGSLASLRIERWPTQSRAPGGTVTAILGAPEEPAARVRAALASREIAVEFDEATLAEAQALPEYPSPEDWAGRPELFDLPVFTIDGEDAKDFDDAVSLEPHADGGWRLGVHIADVSHYAARGTALDREAERRGTSVYLPGRVIPMLPPRLSDQLCSLRPDVPRLTLTCWLELDAQGRPGRADVQATVIRSARRFTYEEVQALLDGADVPRVTPAVRQSVLRMGALAKTLTAERARRGALDFTAPEYQVKTDMAGEPIAVVKRARLDSHRLIEEFMLAANEAVARLLTKARVPFLRRIHENPEPARLEELQAELGRLGIKSTTSLVAHPTRGLQALLLAARGHAFEETANIQVIRSLKLARYTAEPGGHFGLAAPDYCHFTSPIRRYPDLFVHRALKGLISGRPRAHAEGVDVEALARRCSERERLAAEAERRAVDIARASLFGRRVGQEFIGVVVNATAAGLFVALPESGAVGLLRSGGGGAGLGARVKVRLTSVDAALGRLEFSAVDETLPGQVRVTRRRRPK